MYMCKNCNYFPCTREECNIKCGNCVHYQSISSKVEKGENEDE